MTEIDTDDCWLWARLVDWNDYGVVVVSGLHKKAHRVVYEALVGEVPQGLELDHLCNIKRCINPNHLEAVTHKENIIRSFKRGRGAGRTHGDNLCMRGHMLSKDNIYESTSPTGGYIRTCKVCKKVADKLRYQRSK